MEAIQDSTDVLLKQEAEKPVSRDNEILNVFSDLEKGIYLALETYSNVHRGSGHFSMVTTHLFEQARDIVLDYLGLKKKQYTVIFCTSGNVELFRKQLLPDDYKVLSSRDFSLSLGVRALAVKKGVLSKLAPVHTGGGTARLISKNWVVWAKTPEKYEAGTPAIINIIAFARALKLSKKFGKDIFQNPIAEKMTASEIIFNDELDKFSGKDLLNELKQTLIGKNVIVPTAEGMRKFINLDNSAQHAHILTDMERLSSNPEPTGAGKAGDCSESEVNLFRSA